MHDVTGPQLLKILVVTEDRALQRQLSRFLNAVGYHVLQAAGPHSATAAIDAESPQILLLGAELATRSDWALCGLLSEKQPSSAPFRFLLVDEPDESQLLEALEVGIDDFLRKPIDFVELLTRLRAAAGVLESDRRDCGSGDVDPLTGLLSRPSLEGKLRRQLAEHAGSQTRVASIAIDVDYTGAIRRCEGVAAANGLIKAVAAKLEKLRAGSEIVGCFGGDQFCVVLIGANERVAGEWAEHARQVLSSTKFNVGETAWQITVSCGVANFEKGDSPERLIDKAFEALQAAKSSGRNCVVRFGEFGPELPESAEKLLKGTTASDAMVPCSVFLRPSDPAGEAIDLLCRTRLEWIPVVDSDGTLLGVCEQDEAAVVPESHYRSRLVCDIMATDIETADELEPLTSILASAARDSRRATAVVRGRQPLGIVTSNDLATLWHPATAGDAKPAGADHDTHNGMPAVER